MCAFGIDRAYQHLYETRVGPDYPGRFQTAYGSKTMLMIANELNRHSRGDRHVKPNADGSVTLCLSSDSKGKAEDTNFLPVPNENFYLLLRMYGGDEDIQAGKFPVPVVQKVGK